MGLMDLLDQQYHEPVTLDNVIVPEIVVNTESNNGLAVDQECNKSVINCDKKKMPSCNRSSSSKKYRHSKINMAKGPRDRRMRLSLDVARKFFDLHDTLGYDKASETVEWLLIHAKPEIKKLERCLHPEVMINYCDIVGAKSTTSEGEVEAVVMDNKCAAAIRGKLPAKEKKIKHSHKSIIRPLAKDLREKARVRARERTSKKMWSRKFDHDHQSKLFIADESRSKEIGSQNYQANAV